jgi:C_GCAxxG_C_C family probable redox protein
MDKGFLAKENFKSGMNCSQAVVLAFKDELNLDEEVLKKLSIGFGGGVARQRHVCGAVLGMTMVLSYLKSDGEDKLAIYSLIQKACTEFKEQADSIICSELLDAQTLQDTSPVPESRTEKYYAKRPCADMCELAGLIIQKYLKEE